jgi:CheY-like chemotaxis protein
LLIENDLAARQALELLLTQWGCNLRLASSTQESLSTLNKGDDWEPDLIIADQHLNNTERGTSVIRIVRQLIGRRVPAVVVTADPSEKLWKMADQGRLEIMQKPIKPAQLRALMMHLTAREYESNS